jgi:hypothetical protein
MISNIMTIILLEYSVCAITALYRAGRAHSRGRGDGGGDEK